MPLEIVQWNYNYNYVAFGQCNLLHTITLQNVIYYITITVLCHLDSFIRF